jgi:hypothetical protein
MVCVNTSSKKMQHFCSHTYLFKCKKNYIAVAQRLILVFCFTVITDESLEIVVQGFPCTAGSQTREKVTATLLSNLMFQANLTQSDSVLEIVQRWITKSHCY